MKKKWYKIVDIVIKPLHLSLRLEGTQNVLLYFKTLKLTILIGNNINY